MGLLGSGLRAFSWSGSRLSLIDSQTAADAALLSLTLNPKPSLLLFAGRVAPMLRVAAHDLNHKVPQRSLSIKTLEPQP